MSDQFVTPGKGSAADEIHVHRNWQDRPIVMPLDENEKQTNWTCKICNKKAKGVTYTRATRYIGILEDTYGLSKWQLRGVAEGLALRSDLLVKASAAVTETDERTKKDILDQVCEQAREAAGQNFKRELGTALHALTEQIDKGNEPPIPPSFKKDVDAYTKIMAPFQIVDIERFVVLDELRVGGTTDRVIFYKGRFYIADIKTGSVQDPGASKIAMQLATYARSKRYDPETGAREPQNVDLTRGLVIHLPAGQGEASLYWADLEEAWAGIETCTDAWAWRDRRGLLNASEPIDIPALIAMAGDTDGLRQLWAQNENIWNHELTRLAQQRVAELEGAS